MQLTDYHAKYFAHELTRRCPPDSVEKLVAALGEAGIGYAVRSQSGRTKRGYALRTLRLYHRIRNILESARASVARTVNTTQVVANWLIGREIVEEDQTGKRRAAYGSELLPDANSDAARRKSVTSVAALEIRHALRDESWRLARLNHLVK